MRRRDSRSRRCHCGKSLSVNEVSARVNKLRRERRISTQDLAAATGVPLRRLRSVEREDAPPRGDDLRRIANYFGVSVRTLEAGAEVLAIPLCGEPSLEIEYRGDTAIVHAHNSVEIIATQPTPSVVNA